MWKHHLKEINASSPVNILIARTDNIGDLILTLPVIGILKAHFPLCKVTLLARSYTEALVQACTDVDEFIDWDQLKTCPQKTAIAQLKAKQYDIFISTFPQKAIAALMYRAKIPYRIGTTRRWYHLLYCNQLLKLSRVKSNLHEAQLNVKLLAPLGIPTDYAADQLADYWHLKPTNSEKVPALIDTKRFRLIIHPGSNGHAREWPLAHYIQLINELSTKQYQILITGGPKERQRLTPLLEACPQAEDWVGKLSLAQLTTLIANSHAILAASTGPIHIASALKVFALGLYAPKKSMGPQRWRPLGKQAHFLISQPNCSQPCQENQCPCMCNIEVKTVLNHIRAQYQKTLQTT